MLVRQRLDMEMIASMGSLRFRICSIGTLSGYLIFCIVCLFALTGPVNGLELDTKEELERIRREVETHSANLEILAEEQVRFESELKILDTEIGRYRAEQSKVSSELAETNAQIEEIIAELAKLEKQTGELELLSRLRIRAAYMVRPSSFMLAGLIKGDESIDYGRRAYLLGRIREYDLELLEKRRLLIGERQKNRDSLKDAAKLQQSLVEKLTAKQRVVKEKVAQQKSVVVSIAQKRAEIAKLLVALQAQALRIETVVKTLTSGGSSFPVDQAEPAERDQTQNLDGYEGRGLAGRKKELAPPVVGMVVNVQARKGQDFSSILSSRGLEFETGLEAPVFSIAEGRIIHVGEMPGYGLVVIIDHGRRYYSIYGRLSKVVVEVGQEVSLAEEIARASAAADVRRTFYFEIRKAGEPQSPQQFYSRKL